MGKALGQVGRALDRVVAVAAQNVHKVPLDQLVQPLGGVSVPNQAGGVDLRQTPVADPVVEQRRVLGHKGIALYVGQNRRVPLRTDGVERLVNARRVHRGGELDQNIVAPRKGQLAQVKAGQRGGVNHLGAHLTGQPQALGLAGRGHLQERCLAPRGKLLHGNALIIEVRREHNARRTIL